MVIAVVRLGQKQIWCNCALACEWRCTSFDFAEVLACLFICLSIYCLHGRS